MRLKIEEKINYEEYFYQEEQKNRQKFELQVAEPGKKLKENNSHKADTSTGNNVKFKKGFDKLDIKYEKLDDDEFKTEHIFGHSAGLYKFNTLVNTPYNILASGYGKDYPSAGIILNKIYSQDSFDVKPK